MHLYEIKHIKKVKSIRKPENGTDQLPGKQQGRKTQKLAIKHKKDML